ncbi:MAG: hypothetical protein DYG92_14200 [Leptolyngbya sp. PLA1]|nr:hypothetical protein [Leptolyngbya sp. PLA1]
MKKVLVVVILLLAAAGGVYYMVSRTPTTPGGSGSTDGRFAAVRERARAYIAAQPGYDRHRAFTEANFEAACAPADADFGKMPPGFEPGLKSYLAYVRAELAKRAQDAGNQDAALFYGTMKEPPPESR